jgi:hypothetical protein
MKRYLLHNVKSDLRMNASNKTILLKSKLLINALP